MRVSSAILFLAVLTGPYSIAQEHKYWLELKDKSNNPYRIDRPQEFLSAEAIARRLHQGIPVDIKDLPVSPHYERSVKAVGADLLYTSKWFNALAISCDEATKQKLEALAFVKSIRFIGYTFEKNKRHPKSGTQEFEASFSFDTGYGTDQLEMLNGLFLHEEGYKGQGITIAVIDGGFTGMTSSIFFDSLRQKQQFLPSKDFVDGDSNVDHGSTHGTKVLSIMAANQPGLMVGVAPMADYVCIRTENRHYELRIEECNWIAGAEYADSIGADIINTSLGYADFNLKAMDYEQEDMDGQTALISQAADIAFSRGLLVITSAGNNGHSDRGYIDAPGDAKNILTVGSTDWSGIPATFSSYGPTADGRIKPEIVAPGKHVVVGSALEAKVHAASGTSYSAPMIAGLAASLWAAFPKKTNREIRRAIIQSASHPEAMNNKSGAGIPNFRKAYFILKNTPE